MRTRAPYPWNQPPWGSNLWLHLANGAEWVTIAGVRADPKDASAGNFAGGQLARPSTRSAPGRTAGKQGLRVGPRARGERLLTTLET